MQFIQLLLYTTDTYFIEVRPFSILDYLGNFFPKFWYFLTQALHQLPVRMLVVFRQVIQ